MSLSQRLLRVAFASTSDPVKTDRMLRDRIVEIHHRSRGTYGRPRVHAELAAEDVRVGRKRVARLMRKANIEGVHRRRRISTTRRDPAKRAAPDLVKRRFRTDGPDRIWAADITYVPTQAGVLVLGSGDRSMVTKKWWDGPCDQNSPPLWSPTRWTWPSHSGNPTE